ncbi:MAG: hypothetical protein ACU836_04705 [Gammaproteobacteria bacterium]
MNDTKPSQHPDCNRRIAFSLLPSLRKTSCYLLMASLLSACWAPAVTPPVAELNKLHSILIIPVESPPLEIYPDPIEHRIPAYGHYRNIAMPVDLDNQLYRNPAGIVIAGQISQDDDHHFDPIEQPLLPTTLESGPAWSPSQTIAQLAQTKLSHHSVNSVLQRGYHPLPIANHRRNTQIAHWHNAIQDWYAQASSAADYTHTGHFDAVLEVGVAHYRVFEGQTSLQVLLKLINPTTGQTIARSRADTFENDDAALHSLNTDSLAFKRRITEMGAQLLSHALTDIGWHDTPVVASAKQ